jgi:NADPH:quinone reductase-like Zn-dependent oxidoreductase
MKALRLHKPGNLSGISIDEISRPEPGDYDILVKIKATSINFRDYAFITGKYPLVKDLPLVLGSDAAGSVEKTGKHVTRFKEGDRVISLLRQRWYSGKFDAYKAAVQLAASVDGVFSDYYVFHELSAVKVNDTLSFEELATLPTAGLTAFRILTESSMTAGDTVLIQGTGGVSLFALQIARRIGLHAIVTTSTKNNEELVRQLGANEVINYREQANWHEVVLEKTNGKGVDLTIDVVGGPSVQQSINATAVNGQVALIGFLEDTSATIDLVSVIRRNINLKAYTTGSREDLEQFVKFVEVNKLKPVISGVYYDYQTAFSLFQSRKVPGKIVVRHE